MKPKISICIPFHFGMKNWQFFLTRCLESIEKQTFKDYEVILIKHSTMPVTSNRAIESAMGELIKVLYVDDYFAHPNALLRMVELMDVCNNDWLIVAADTNPRPYWTDDIETGNNKLGSPSALMMRRKSIDLFDENLSWLLDCDLYKRLYNKYGAPAIFEEEMITIGIHEGQMTNILTNEEKLKEFNYMQKKYEKQNIW